jgi:CRISPR-associated protein Cst2
MKDVKMVTGSVLIDAPASALNNAGIQAGRQAENRVIVKKIRKGREEYPYVSGQAVKYWWRETIHQKFNWAESPITREKKVAYTEGNPIKYEEDDIFGYMVAPAQGEEKGLVYRRIAPLKCTPLISLFGNVITGDFGVFARGPASAEPVPYEQEFYSTVLKGTFSLMLSEVGVFLQGLSKDLPSESDTKQEQFKERVNNIIVAAKDIGATIEPSRIILPLEERKKRIKESLLSISEMAGGAKTTNYLTDVSPKFIVTAVLNCANHIFMDVVTTKDGRPILNIDALSEIVKDYKDKFLSPIYIGLRKGFFDDTEYDRISKLSEIDVGNGKKIKVEFGTPKGSIQRLVNYVSDNVSL